MDTKRWVGSDGGLLTLCRMEGYPVDETTDREVLLSILSGVTDALGSTKAPIYATAEKMETFITENRYRLNLSCSGKCRDCTDFIVATCGIEYPKIVTKLKEDLNNG